MMLVLGHLIFFFFWEFEFVACICKRSFFVCAFKGSDRHQGCLNSYLLD